MKSNVHTVWFVCCYYILLYWCSWYAAPIKNAQHKTESYALLTWATRVLDFWSCTYKLSVDMQCWSFLGYLKFYDYLSTTDELGLCISFLSYIIRKHCILSILIRHVLIFFYYMIFYLSFLRWAFQYLGAIDTNTGDQVFLQRENNRVNLLVLVGWEGIFPNTGLLLLILLRKYSHGLSFHLCVFTCLLWKESIWDYKIPFLSDWSLDESER